jgi:acylphosphatase
MKRHVTIVVKGKVHGVFYRDRAREMALRLGIVGYVQNNDDGTVTIEAIGAPQHIAQLITWCQRGPQLARVDAVVVQDGGSDECYHTFTII